MDNLSIPRSSHLLSEHLHLLRTLTATSTTATTPGADHLRVQTNPCSGNRNTSNKRPSPDYDDEDYDNNPFAPKKAKSKVVQAASDVTTGMVFSLRERLLKFAQTVVSEWENRILANKDQE